MNKHPFFNFFQSLHISRQALRVMACSSMMFLTSFVILSTGPTNAAETAKPVNDFVKTQTLIVAGGCFWCVESDFDKYPGVIDVISGYTGGFTDNPTYKEVTYKNTGHYEAAKITFDPNKTSLKELTEYFWATVDPIDSRGQFCDKGDSYKTALFYQDDEQKKVFDESLAYLKKNKPFKGEVATKILAAKKFYPAEDYHQNFKKKNPLRYHYYRSGCGRDARIKQLWGKVASKELKEKS